MNDSARPSIRVYGPTENVRGVALLLHGGRERSHGRVHRYRSAYLRMLPFARDIRHEGAADGVAAWALRYRYRGWNAPELDPVLDAAWALDEIRRAHGDVPVALVGHSMGGRTALRVAGADSVVAVCALAPWTKPNEPVEQLAGRTVLIAHGLLDKMTDPELSFRYAARAKAVTERVAHFDVHDEGHAMLRKSAAWTRLVTGFTLGALGTQPFDPVITNALGQPSPEGLRIPL
ncbi:alpha/beta hydrolase [Actinokineospora xionganensis]|uniref:alpha/beta hydrolase n=1 Tax=Actinokineospora xionganensis TaxID=2684470 RepID=UPI0028AE7374|nr:alpha/beta fold hydrolase [Actinokineospora xionganensis]